MALAVAKRPTRAKTSTDSHSTRTESRDDATFLDHLHELRARFFWVGVVFAVASGAAYYFKDPLVSFIMAPLGGEKLIYLSVGGGFNFIFQITMLAGLFAAAPVIILQLYRFVAPALPMSARRSSAIVVLCSVTLLLSGAAFGYYVAVPAAIHFLTTFAEAHVTSSLTAESYLSFVLTYLLGLGIVFQLPILLVFWHWISPMSPKKLFASQRFLIVFAFIAAAIITPTPDVVNQLIIAGPVIGVYQLGVVSVLAMHYRQRTRGVRQKYAQPTEVNVPAEFVRAAIQEQIHSIDEALRHVATIQIPPPRTRKHHSTIALPTPRGIKPTASAQTAARTFHAARTHQPKTTLTPPPRLGSQSISRHVMPKARSQPLSGRRVSIDGFGPRRAVS